MNDVFEYPFDSKYILRKKKILKRELLLQNDLVEKRIAILSGSTVGDMKDIMELFLLYFKVKPIFYIGNYNCYYEDIMFENNELLDFNPDIIYIHTSIRNMDSSSDIYNKLLVIWNEIRAKFTCLIIQNNFELPYYNFLDNHMQVTQINLNIFNYEKQNKDFYVNDINYLSSCFGLEKWFDEQSWYMYKYAFNINTIPLVGHNIAKIIKSALGKDQKCLICDLDNTLWGGVVGEVGVLGIELGMNSAMGEAYLEFQQYIKKLHDIGIIIAICSKNDKKTAKNAFSNPNMVLKLEDISVFCANWENKSENIKNIAETLNILPNSIVFIDDNPAEQDIVKINLPDVKVPKVNTIFDFIKYIDKSGYFNITNVSSEDKNRNDYYNMNIQRTQYKKSFNNYHDYLISLNMWSKISAFDNINLNRITQLINKTNQFNLTSKRYTLSEIEKLIGATKYITMYADLNDKFGSNGIVSVLIGEIIDLYVYIELWVMSCRVFKRDLELAVFDQLIINCKEKGIKKIIGYYYKTDKNNFVENLYKELGFTKESETVWGFDIPINYENKNNVIIIT